MPSGLIKLRYGLQICSNVRITEEEAKNAHIKKAQLAQNKLLRMLDNSTLKDRKTTIELLLKFGMHSVNQLAASIKLTDFWKTLNIADYPVRLEKMNLPQNCTAMNLRHWNRKIWN